MSTAIPPDPWGRTALCTALAHWCYRGSYKSGGLNPVTACLKKLLELLFTKDRWISEIQRKEKTSLSFCAEKSTRCKKSQWSLLNSAAVCAVAQQWVCRQSPERVIRLPQNCCTALLDMLETVLYLVSNTGPVSWKGNGLFRADSEQPAITCCFCGWTRSKAGQTSLKLSGKTEGNSPCHDVVQDGKTTASRAN